MATELNLQLGAKETWIGVVTVASGGNVDLEIKDASQHLINLLKTYTVGAFWGIVDIEVLALTAAGSYHLSDAAILALDAGVGFKLTDHGAPNGNVTYFVKVRVPHTKTN